MNEFKKRTFCGHLWLSRKAFLGDASTDLIGYQVSFDFRCNNFKYLHSAI